MDLRNGDTQIFDIALDECSSWRRGVVDRRNVLVDCLTQSVLADIASSCSEDVLGQPLADLLRVQAPIVQFEPGRGKRAAARRAEDETEVGQRLVCLGHRIPVHAEFFCHLA